MARYSLERALDEIYTTHSTQQISALRISKRHNYKHLSLKFIPENADTTYFDRCRKAGGGNFHELFSKFQILVKIFKSWEEIVRPGSRKRELQKNPACRNAKSYHRNGPKHRRGASRIAASPKAFGRRGSGGSGLERILPMMRFLAVR